MDIPPVNTWNSSLGRNSSPVGNHWSRTYTVVILCFERLFSKQNSAVAVRLKSYISPKKIWVWLRHWPTRHGSGTKQNLFCIRGTLRCECPQTSRWKCPKSNFGRISDINYIPWQANSVLVNYPASSPRKSRTTRFINLQNDIYLSSEKDILGQ